MDNEFNILLKAELDQSATTQQILSDIQSIQKRLDREGQGKLRIKAEIDTNLLKSIKDIAKNSDVANVGKDLGNQLATNLINTFNIKSKEAHKKIRELSGTLYDISVGELKTGKDNSAFINTLNQLGDIVEKNANIIKSRMGIYDDFYRYFQGISKIKIPDSVRKEMGTDWNLMRMTAAGKFVTSKNGIELDSVYQEMSDKYKDIFSGTPDPTQQFKEIINAVKLYRADIDKLEPVQPGRITGFTDDMWDNIFVSIGNMRAQIKQQIPQISDDTRKAAQNIKKSLLDIDISFENTDIQRLGEEIRSYFSSLEGISDKDVKIKFFKDADEEITSFHVALDKGKGIIENYQFALNKIGKFSYSGGNVTDTSGKEFSQVAAKAAELQNRLESLKATYSGFLSGTGETNPFKKLVESIDFSTVTDNGSLEQMYNLLKQAQSQAQSLNSALYKQFSSSSAEKMTQNLARMGDQIDLIKAKFEGANFQIPENIVNMIAQMKENLSALNSIDNPLEKINAYNQLQQQIKELGDAYALLSKQQQNINDSENLLSGKQKLGADIVRWMMENRSASHEFDAELIKIITNLQNVTNVSELTILNKQFSAVKAQAEAANIATKGFLSGIKERMAGALASTVKYAASIGIINKTRQAIREMIKDVEELQNAMIGFNKVAGLSEERLEEFTEKAYETGNKIARTGKDIVAGMSEFRRAGYDIEDVLEMSEAANIMVNVADGINDISKAASSLIAIIRGYSIDKSDIMSVVDIMNEVSNNSPVGFDNLADGLERTSGTLSQTGTSLAENVGLLTAGFAQLRNMEKVSTGLITISQRLRGVGEDGEAIDGLSGKLKEDFGSIGIDIENANGELRSTYDIINDYAKVFPELTSKQRQYFGELASGKHQVTVWNAIVAGIDDVNNAIDQADNSLGSAAKENEIYMNSIAGARNAYQNALDEFAKEAVDDQWITDFIQAGTSMLKMFTNIISTDTVVRAAIGDIAGLVKNLAETLEKLSGNRFLASLAQAFIVLQTAKMGTEIVTIASGAKDASNMFKNLIEVVRGYGTAQEVAEQVVINTTDAVDTMTGSLAKNKKGILSCITALGKFAISHPAIIAVSVALIAGAKVFDNYIHRVDRANEAMREAASEYESVKSGLQSINSELETQKQRLDELQGKDNLTYAEEDELKRLQKITAELEAQQVIEEKRAARAARESAETAIDAYEKQYGNSDISKEYIRERIDSPKLPLADKDDIAENIAVYVNAEKLLQEAWEKYNNAKNSGNDDKINKFYDDIRYYENIAENQEGVLEDIISNLEEKRQQLEESYNTALEKQQSGDILTPFDQSVIDTYDEIYESIKRIHEYVDPNAWNQIQFNRIFATDGIELTKNELIEMYKAGELTKEVLQSYPNLFNAISNADFLSTEQFDITNQNLQNIRTELENLSNYGNVDLVIRPIVDSSGIKGQFIWQGDEQTGRYVYVHYTPVLPNGEVMSDDELSNYISESLEGAQDILEADTEKIVIKVDTDFQIPEEDILKYNQTSETTEDIDKLIGSATNWDNHVNRTQESFQKKQNIFNGIIDKSNEVLNQISAEAESDTLQDSGQKPKNDLSSSFKGFSDDQTQAIDKFQSKVKTLKDALSTLEDGGDPGFTDLVQEFPELQGQSNNLELAIKRLIQDSLNELYDTIGEGLPDDVKRDLQSITDAALDLSPSLDEAFSAAQKSYDAFHDFEKAMNSDGLTDSVLSSVGALSDSLNDMVAGFYGGAVSSEQLYQALSEHYETDLLNYTAALITKNAYSEDFYNAMGMNSAETVNKFFEDYGVDIENCKNYNEAKMEIENQTLKTISGAWEKYYDIQTDSFTKQMESLGQSAYKGDARAAALYAEIQERVEAYRKAKEGIANITLDGSLASFEGISRNLDKAANSASKAGEKEKEAVIETIDWIERKNQILKDTHDTLMEVAEDETLSYDERCDALRELIEMDKERAEIAEQSAQKYEEEWEKAIEGLKEEDIARIEEGDIDIAQYEMKEGGEYGEDYVDNLKKAMDLYDQMNDMRKEANDIEKEHKEHVREEIRLYGELIDDEMELLSLELERAQARLDMAEASGKAVTESMYRSMISSSDDIIDKYRDKISNLEDQQWEIDDEDSAEYLALEAEIEQCRRAISDCEKQQEEWNDAIKRIPIDRIGKYISMLQNIKQDLQNFLDQQSAMGLEPSPEQMQQMIDLSQEEISKLLEQQEKLQKLLMEYEYGSEKYEQVSQEIQDIDNQISSLIQSQMEYNEAILRAPIDQLSRQSELLSNARTDLENSIAEQEANGINKTLEQYQALSSISRQQIENLSAQKEMLTALLGVYDKDSTKYHDTLNEIQGIEDSISSLVQEQAQWNDEILQIPIDTIQEYVDSLSNARSDLENGIAQQEAGGVSKTLEQYQALQSVSMKQLEALSQQKAVLQVAMEVYDKDSTQYKEAQSQLQGIEDNISSLIQEQITWNNEILQIPINRLEDYSSFLTNARTDLENSIAEQEARGISKTMEQYQAMQSMSMRQIENLSRQKEMLTALLDIYDKDSSQYAETQDKIQSIEGSISSLIQEQAKWNQEILRIPIDKISSQADALSNVRKNLESHFSGQEASGISKTLDQYQTLHAVSMEQIRTLSQQKQMLTSLLDVYDKDSNLYKQTQNELQGVEDSISSLIQEQIKWNQEILRIPIEKLEGHAALLSNARSDLENSISEQETKGIGKTLDQYKALQSVSMEQIQNLNRQKETLTALLDVYDKDSSQYSDTLNEIQGIEDSISSLVQEQIKWNDEILRMPIDKMSEYSDSLDSVKSDLQGFIDTQNVRGIDTTIDQYQQLNAITLTQLEALKSRKEMLTQLMGQYDKDSDAYKTASDEIREVDSAIQSLVKEQYEWNQAILQIPIDNIADINEELNRYSSTLGDVLSDYDTALSAVNNVLDEQIDKINESREASEKAYEDKIKPIQDELDLLRKQNEERSVQLALEQAAYDLDRAKNQKTTQVKMIA